MGRKPVHFMCVKASEGVDDSNASRKRGNNKFYDMIEENGRCVCRYGRIEDGYIFGKSGKVAIKSLSEWDKVYNEKLKHGYVDKTEEMTEQIKMEEDSANEEKNSLYAPIENKNIAKIVDRLQYLANHKLEDTYRNYKVNYSCVSKTQVDSVQDILNIMAKRLEKKDIDYIEFNNYLYAIFETLPRKMNNVNNYTIKASDNIEAFIECLNREQDLLDVMRGQIISPVRGQKVITADGNKKTILQLNGINFEEVDSKDIELIKSRMGSRSDLFVNAWKVSNDKQSKAYMKYCTEENLRKRDCKLLWHGTRSENVWSILKTGLVLRPTNAVITGHMLGQGLYFAPDFLKSHNYTSARGTTWAGGTQDTGFMILHAVAYGTPYDVTSFNEVGSNFNYHNLEKLSAKNGKKYNCVHAHKGMNTGWSNLRADEIVVYKEEQVMPLYLVEVR